MTSIDAAIAFRLNLLHLLDQHGYPDIPIIAANQPRKQGRVDDGIYYQLLMPNNYGWQARRYNPNDDAGHSEHQLYEVTMQLTALVSDEYETGYTSSDLAAVTQMVCNSLPFVKLMRDEGIGIQRASSIRTLDFVDEHDNYAIEASFDVNITFMRSIYPATAVVDSMNLEMS